MMTAPAAPVSGPTVPTVRPRWYRAYRAARVALSLSPLIAVHLALVPVPARGRRVYLVPTRPAVVGQPSPLAPQTLGHPQRPALAGRGGLLARAHGLAVR